MRAIPLSILMLAAAVALSGCATKKNYYATGGSRADGTVDMAYDFRQFEKPVVSQDQAHSIAKAKCSVWGYRDAEAFGGMTQNCYKFDGWGNCAAGQVIIKYQCLGNLDAPSAMAAPVSPLAPVSAPALGSSSASASAMGKAQWQQQQLQKLMNDTSLNYEEYTRRRQQIMAE